MSSPLQAYQAALATGDFVEDSAQARAVAELERAHSELVAYPPKPDLRNRFARKLLGRDMVRWPPVQGVYLWGGVGRGKTWLMDAFFDSLPFERKRRTHFHRFMRDVHRRRAALTDTQDPLDTVADDIAKQARVLCFDEFFVSDIADAMILGRLTQALFERGVTLVATSNCSPDMLYRDGLQRAKFVPAIERLQAHCTVLNVDGGNDYRMRALQAQALYVVGDGHAELTSAFTKIDAVPGTPDTTVEINGRNIPAKRLGETCAWFSFDALCGGPRSADDYIELAKEFQWLLLSGVPVLDGDLENEARRFITLVDECYDRNVKLMLAAAAPLDGLYVGKRLAFEFERTQSRLTEMQSDAFLSRPHLG